MAALSFRDSASIQPPALTAWNPSYEVGLASAMGKQTFVFEQLGSNVSFPIPYFTDYVPYGLRMVIAEGIEMGGFRWRKGGVNPNMR